MTSPQAAIGANATVSNPTAPEMNRITPSQSADKVNDTASDPTNPTGEESVMEITALKADKSPSALTAPDLTAQEADQMVSASTMPQLEDSPALEPGNALYTVFPKAGVDVSETINFIKATVGADDLHPWTDVAEHLMHWTVEASAEEVTKLEGHAGIDRVSKLELPPTPVNLTPHVSRADQERESFMIFPKDGKNQEQNNGTDKALRDMLQERLQKPYMSVFDGRLRWWVATMTTEEVKKAGAVPGVRSIEPNTPLEPDFVLPEHPPPSSSPTRLPVLLERRAISYTMQPDAVSELVAISQPSDIPLKDLKNYVYETHNGEGIFVYHIERGVAFNEQKEEFPHVAPEHILTRLAAEFDQEPDKDESSQPWVSHGTCTAGKALGQKFGSAKKATLVVVRLATYQPSEVFQAMELIAKDVLKDRGPNEPTRHKKSIAVMSLGNSDLKDDDRLAELKASVVRLVQADVPLVVTAGNYAQPGGREVDRYPALLGGTDLPVIVVGSVNTDGQKSAFSQGGPCVTLHAVGEGDTCLSMDKSQPPMVRQGTSLSAPLVAGQIANLLSYETVPFDTSDGNLVKNLKAYLTTDKASWERVPGIRTLWNGVTKEEHDKLKAGGQNNAAQPQPQPQPPPDKLSCSGLTAGKYVSYETVRDVIENKFCPEVVKQEGLADLATGTFSRTYHEKTPEEMHLTIDFKPGLGFKPDQAYCVAHFLQLVDNCDGNDPQGNPQNYKGGGLYTKGDVNWKIEPKGIRPPAKNGKKAGCDSTYKFLWDEFWVWGHGFASTDYGASLKDQIQKRCALYPDTWSFEYGTGDDGREWTARFRTAVWQKECVGQFAVKNVAGFSEFYCNGSG